MARRTWRRDSARLIDAAAQDVIRVAELMALGIRPSVIHHRCQPGGPWRRILPGVVIMHTGPPSWPQQLQAALLFGGPNAMLTGAAAARLHGLRRGGDATMIHLLIPEGDRRRSTDFVLIERTIRLPDAQSVQGFPVAPPVRAVLDRARRLPDRTAIQALLAEAVQRRFCRPAELITELDEGSCRGTALVRVELADIAGGARSVAEIRAKRLARRADLPEPLWNVELFTADGTYVATPDAWWPEVGMAWEIDSTEHHLSPADHDRTLRRNARYAAHGITFLQTKPSRLGREGPAVIAELEATYTQAQRRVAPTFLLQRPA